MWINKNISSYQIIHGTFSHHCIYFNFLYFIFYHLHYLIFTGFLQTVLEKLASLHKLYSINVVLIVIRVFVLLISDLLLAFITIILICFIFLGLALHYCGFYYGFYGSLKRVQNQLPLVLLARLFLAICLCLP